MTGGKVLDSLRNLIFRQRHSSIPSTAEGQVDDLVWTAFFAGKKERRKPIMVEVGAAGPDQLSIGAYYRARGWRVVSIEPNPDFCRMHRERGHEILQYACGDRDDDDVDFQVVDAKGALYEGGAISFEAFSSLGPPPRYAEMLAKARSAEGSQIQTKMIKVNLRTLDTLLAGEARHDGPVDLVAVDVEGWELSVLRGLDFVKRQPSVVIVENLFRDPVYSKFMEERAYRLWKVVAPNEIYCSPSARRHLEVRRGARSWVPGAPIFR